MTRYRIGAFGAMVEDERGEWVRYEDVLTPRDYFAAAVLPAMFAALDRDCDQTEMPDPALVALGAYDVADAMLAERAKEAK